MKTRQFQLSFLILSVVFLFQCKEKDDEQSYDPAILIAHTWKISDFTVNPPIDFDEDGIADENAFEYFYGTECWQNNQLTFKSDFTAHYSQMCGEMLQDFTWSMSNNNTQIKLGYLSADIKKLDETSFTISYDMETDNGTSKARVTYTSI